MISGLVHAEDGAALRSDGQLMRYHLVGRGVLRSDTSYAWIDRDSTRHILSLLDSTNFFKLRQGPPTDCGLSDGPMWEITAIRGTDSNRLALYAPCDPQHPVLKMAERIMSLRETR